ncbi:MAG: hypothetical protein ABSA17_01360 [Rhabdochlamydiaceae bacterium]|jgi:hypothetical protein
MCSPVPSAQQTILPIESSPKRSKTTEGIPIFYGQVPNDYKGKAQLTYDFGDVCIGEFENGRLQGEGERTYSDGCVYVGPFKNGECCGEGALTYPDGTVYSGQFDDNYMISVEGNHPEIELLMLLLRNLDLDGKPKENVDEIATKIFLEHGNIDPDFVNRHIKQDNEDCPLVWIAARLNCTKLLEAMIKRKPKANINYMNFRCQTAFSCVIESNEYNLALQLLRLGQRVNLQACCFFSREPLLVSLFRASEPFSATKLAVTHEILEHLNRDDLWYNKLYRLDSDSERDWISEVEWKGDRSSAFNLLMDSDKGCPPCVAKDFILREMVRTPVERYILTFNGKRCIDASVTAASIGADIAGKLSEMTPVSQIDISMPLRIAQMVSSIGGLFREVPEQTFFEPFCRDIRQIIGVKILRVFDPDLNNLPDRILVSALDAFEVEKASDVIACRVLQKWQPVDKSVKKTLSNPLLTPMKRKEFRRVIQDAIVENSPGSLNRQKRDAITTKFSTLKIQKFSSLAQLSTELKKLLQ